MSKGQRSAEVKGQQGPLSPDSSEVSRSLIPRVVTPPALRKMYPKGLYLYDVLKIFFAFLTPFTLVHTCL